MKTNLIAYKYNNLKKRIVRVLFDEGLIELEGNEIYDIYPHNFILETRKDHSYYIYRFGNIPFTYKTFILPNLEVKLHMDLLVENPFRLADYILANNTSEFFLKGLDKRSIESYIFTSNAHENSFIRSINEFMSIDDRKINELIDQYYSKYNKNSNDNQNKKIERIVYEEIKDYLERIGISCKLKEA